MLILWTFRFTNSSENNVVNNNELAASFIIILVAIIKLEHEWPVQPAKTHISLGIRPVWSEFAVCLKKVWVLATQTVHNKDWSDWTDASLQVWKRFGSLATQNLQREDSDQTGQMARLIWVFPLHAGYFVVPPTSKKLRGIHVLVSVCPSVCPSFTLGYVQKLVAVGFWNCIYRTSIKNKGTHFFFSRSDLLLQSYAPLSTYAV